MGGTSVYEQVKEWLERNFEFKGRSICRWYGSYKGTYDNVEPTFRFDTDNSSFNHKSCDFSIRIHNYAGRCHVKIEIFLASYYEWETCFQGVVPSLDFLEQLFNCFVLTEHGLA